MGNRILKVWKPKGDDPDQLAPETSWKYTYYVRDASGTVLAIYDRFYEPTEDAEVFHERFILAEAPVYGSSRLGSYRPERVVASVQWRLSDVNPATGLYNNRDMEETNVAQFAPGEQVLSRISGEKSYELTNHLGNVLSVVSDKKVYDRDWQADLQSSQDYYAFGMQMSGRSYNSEVYRFGFNGKENDNEIIGVGNWQDYGQRMYSSRLGRFLSVDPLIKQYPELSTYQFASNTPIQAIDQDGLEAFIVHGTTQTQTGVNFTGEAVSQFKRITGNSASDDRFRWNAPIYNDSKMRKVAAEQLVNHIVETRSKLMSSGEITENESVSLVGYSHGGNVSIQAAQMLKDKYGIKVNLITVGTPAKNSAFGTDSDNPIFGNSEDPQGNSGINSHFHIRHMNDGVWKIADASGDKSDAYYSNPGATRNFDIPNTSIDLPGPIKSHTDLPSHTKFGKVLRALPKMSEAPAAGNLEKKL